MMHKKHGYLPEDAVLFESLFGEDDPLVEFVETSTSKTWSLRCRYVCEVGDNCLGLWRKSELKPLTRAAQALYEVL